MIISYNYSLPTVFNMIIRLYNCAFKLDGIQSIIKKDESISINYLNTEVNLEITYNLLSVVITL